MFQLIAVQPITASIYTGPKKPGEAFWVNTQKAARVLIESGLCRWPSTTVAFDESLVLRHGDGHPVNRFSLVNRVWVGETVVLVAAGPSVTQAQVDRCKGRARVVVVNNSYLLAPWADLLYFADSRWWKWHKENPVFTGFKGQKCTIEGTGLEVEDPNVFILHNANSRGQGQGFSEKPDAIVTGGNSGYMAMNIAVLAGAARLVLLGYDFKFAPGKKSHWHGDHPPEGQISERSYRDMVPNFRTTLPQLERLGVEVVNCSPDSALDCYQRGDVESVFAD